MDKPVLVVMAAGMGSRYGGLKQIDPVGPSGELIIDYSIFDACRAGFQTVIFVIKPELETTFRYAIGDRLSRYIDVKYAYQSLSDLPAGYSCPQGRIKPWGTCHAVLAARRLVSGPFAVINADDYYGPQAFQAIYRYLSTHPDQPDRYQYAMVGYSLGNTVTDSGTVARGICTEDGEHCLLQVTERTQIAKDGPNARYTEDDGATWISLPGDTVVSMNLWGFHRSFLDEAFVRFPAFLRTCLVEDPLKGEYFLPSVVTQLIDGGRAQVTVLRSQDKWYGVTYQQDKPVVMDAIARLIREGLYPKNLWGDNETV